MQLSNFGENVIFLLILYRYTLAEQAERVTKTSTAHNRHRIDEWQDNNEVTFWRDNADRVSRDFNKMSVSLKQQNLRW